MDSKLLGYLSIAAVLVMGKGFCSEKETEQSNPEPEKEASSTNNETGPSIAETIANIANDPGAGLGGDR